jgi:flagella basal body P-ring formation protein FlgA
MNNFRSLSLLGLSFLVLTASCFAAEPISKLTGKTLITGDVVTVGDLFTNADGSADHVLAAAPAIGKTLALSASDLQNVVKAFRLNFKERIDNGIDLERDAFAVDKEKIAALLNDSDLKSRIDTGAEFQISNIQDPIIVPGHQTPELSISDTSYDLQNKKFSAVLNISRDNKVLKQVTVEGEASVMIHVPVLKFSMAYDTVITEDDIGEIVVPQTQLRGDAIFNRDDLVGMTTKRSLNANQVVSQQDVTPPLLVKRNDLVTIVYKKGSIQLSSKARSLANGSRGDNIQFINTTSKKAFEAKVTGPQMAEVNVDG